MSRIFPMTESMKLIRKPKRSLALFLLPLLYFLCPAPAVAAEDPFSWLTLHARQRVETAAGSGKWQAQERTVKLDPQRTAIVICDMWDKHWCAGATRRVAEMAPRMNEVVKKARAQGVLIIHCPSDTMKFYEGTPERRLAQAAPKVETKVPLQNWCNLDRTKEAPLPIDDSDGGCDDWPQCKTYRAWTRQIPAIEMKEGDAVTDSAEAYYLMRQRGITNVIAMGVHLNMCVLGRPFSIRQMVQQGQNVFLMRDLTDTMYNSRKRPYVPHCVGTDLMVEHVEKYWCASVTSVDFLGGQPFRFQEDKRPKVVFMIGEDEYKTWETLPEFADSVLRRRGFDCTIVQQDPADKNRFPGLVEALRDADLLLISVRRRTPPRQVLDAIRAHLDAGKPIVGIRTACHAFTLMGDGNSSLPKDGSRSVWPEFDAEVWGGNYHGHHGNNIATLIQVATNAAEHPILAGIDVSRLRGNGSLYRVSPLKEFTHPLLTGSIPGQPPEPVAWTRIRGSNPSRIFYTSLGHPDDFTNEVFREFLLNAVRWALNRPVPVAGLAPDDPNVKYARDWQPVRVPGTWEDNLGLPYDGTAWYRCLVRIPAGWLSAPLQLSVENVDNAYEAFFNGVKVGEAGKFPPQYQNGLDQALTFDLPADQIRVGEWNVVALRIYDHEGRGGFKGNAPRILKGDQAISLEGEWQFRVGDNAAWAKASSESLGGSALFNNVVGVSSLARARPDTAAAAKPKPLSPEESARQFTVPDDLEIEPLLSEPVVAQPLQISFDERGRMWVVQYRQYPAPAGLELVSHDEFWRAVYDKVPPPPPHQFRGRDRISIHEDTDGDGKYDKHTVFVDGLNIATAAVRGRGGVWVLNPPYLLFYPDRNNDDVPDGDPEVRLSGFGLEDTHSVVNSLRWGPDGWLYAAQGSTVSARVVRPGQKEDPWYSEGQNIWRYHPETRQYEVFAEGGGNTFGVEIDPKGRIFSGHNGGDTRGFHYMQGAYLLKGFQKHGQLSNPYAFGYFPSMPHHRVERFDHTFLIYDGGSLPAFYEGKLFGAEPLQGRVVLSDIQPDGSTFRTKDLGHPVVTKDRWFKPVDIKAGPDGAVYIADWYDAQVNHWRNYQGNMDASNGRIYRLKAKGARPGKPFDLGKLSGPDLVKLLQNKNEWFRQTALRLLADRRDASLVPLLEKIIWDSSGQTSLEALWALNLCSPREPNRTIGLTEAQALKLLKHPDPFVRLWTVRLSGDEKDVSSELARAFAVLAAQEPNVEVRAQLACTAKRLPASEALPVVRRLLARDEDATDPRQPLLLWWALESKAESDRDAVLSLFEDSTLWNWPMVRRDILGRIMRRYAATGRRSDLLTCARLLELSPSREHSLELMAGFEEAFRGRSLAGLPEDLIKAFAARDLGSPAFRLRQGQPGALDQALRVVADDKAEADQRRQFIEILGEVKQPSAVDSLLKVAASPGNAGPRKAALTALLIYDDPRIGAEVSHAYTRMPEEVRVAAQTLLSSRAAWSRNLVRDVESGQIAAADVPLDVVLKIKLHDDAPLRAQVARLWPRSAAPTTSEIEGRIRRFASLVRHGNGNPYQGKTLFNTTCGVCHKLFNQGGEIGPDLTTYQRTDLDAVLVNIVNPSAEIREGYQNFLIETKDDRALSGFIVEQDKQVVVVRGLDGQRITLKRDEITSMKTTGTSLMPEGLLDGFDEQQVRDLFAYLRSSQPLP
jgi:putative membrane-bound dehydrogenase-like protein